jgi:sec-independent protein translocase protein TatA
VRARITRLTLRKENVMKLLLFVIGTEWIIVLVVVAILLLFGGTKLPQLAKALGQSKKAFKEGIDEGDRETDSRSKLNSVDDEALFDEARRRAQQVRSDDAKKIDR